MIVTRIERQKRTSDRTNLYLDGRFAFGIHQEVLLRSGIRKGDDLSADRLRQILASEELALARSRALKLLSFRLRSEAEVRSSLLEKEFHPVTVDRVIEDLRLLRLVDDTRFSRAYIHDSGMKRALGTIALRRELLKRGVPKEIVQNVLAERAASENEPDLALAAASKLLARLRSSRKKIPAGKQRERTAQFLGRRGYSWDTISGVLRKLFAGEAPE